VKESPLTDSPQPLKRSAPGATHRTFGTVNVRIEKLVLHGFSPSACNPIGEAMQRELRQLFVERGVPPLLENCARIESLDASPFYMARDGKPEVIGAQLAQVIFGSLNG
jgi:hypothetical protein